MTKPNVASNSWQKQTPSHLQFSR